MSTKNKRYQVSLSMRMVVALGDMANDFSGDSPRYDLRTLRGLTTRGLVLMNENDAESASITKRGALYFDLALDEMARNKGWVKAIRTGDTLVEREQKRSAK